MNTFPKYILLLLAVVVFQFSFSQTAKQKAEQKGQEAVKLEDEGKFDAALKLLAEAQKLDPDNLDYVYEEGYSYYAQKEYKKALEAFKRVLKYKGVTDRCYAMLGNVYDDMHESDKALRTYDDGLKLFPKSGRLYLEIGNVYWGKKDYEKALPFYEKGVEMQPEFPSNYYRAALIYCNSNNAVWGMIYGEIFMNLERETERTKAISKLLYNTYKNQIKFKKDSGSIEIDFCQNATINASALKGGDLKLPFGNVCYEKNMLLSLIGEKGVNLSSLDRIRMNFITNYFKAGDDKKFPNVLFDYQNEVMKAGHLEAYNHWVLKEGDEQAFNRWRDSNKDKWDSFQKWFEANKLRVNSTHRFYRDQYN